MIDARAAALLPEVNDNDTYSTGWLSAEAEPRYVDPSLVPPPKGWGLEAALVALWVIVVVGVALTGFALGYADPSSPY